MVTVFTLPVKTWKRGPFPNTEALLLLFQFLTTQGGKSPISLGFDQYLATQRGQGGGGKSATNTIVNHLDLILALVEESQAKEIIFIPTKCDQWALRSQRAKGTNELSVMGWAAC